MRRNAVIEQGRERLGPRRCAVQGCMGPALDGPFCKRCVEEIMGLRSVAALEDARCERKRMRRAARRQGLSNALYVLAVVAAASYLAWELGAELLAEMAR